MPWKAFPFGDERSQKFKTLFGVTGIPTLLILTPDGLLVTKDGRKHILEHGENAWLEWMKLREEALARPPPIKQASIGSPQVIGNSHNQIGQSSLLGVSNLHR